MAVISMLALCSIIKYFGILNFRFGVSYIEAYTATFCHSRSGKLIAATSE